jgi:hypothetical protein
MKNSKILLAFLMLFYVLVGCSNVKTSSIVSTANNASPESVLKLNPNADIFILDSTVYINATDIDWVKKLTLTEGKILGKINETGVKKEFKDWNATKLNVNAPIYESKERKDIVLVKVDNKFRPYLKYVEG